MTGDPYLELAAWLLYAAFVLLLFGCSCLLATWTDDSKAWRERGLTKRQPRD